MEVNCVTKIKTVIARMEKFMNNEALKMERLPIVVSVVEFI